MSKTLINARAHYKNTCFIVRSLKDALDLAEDEMKARRNELIKAQLREIGANPVVRKPETCIEEPPELNDQEYEGVAIALSELYDALDEGLMNEFVSIIVANVEPEGHGEYITASDVKYNCMDYFVSHLYYDGSEWHYVLSHSEGRDIIHVFNSSDHQELVDFHQKLSSMSVSSIEIFDAFGLLPKDDWHNYETLIRRDQVMS